METWLEVRRNANSESIDIFIKKVFILIAIFIRVGLYTIYYLYSPLYRVITQNLEYSYSFNHGGIIDLVASVDSLSNVTDLSYIRISLFY